jgi:diadenosine tetraphosphatase ApaH/serine/threonine PP2A family protein phosphatase
MRIAVLSDIHANMDAFEQVLADIEATRPEAVISLGDAIGYGAEPERVLEALQRRSIPSVLGNHELAAQDPGFLDWFNPAARRSLALTFERLGAEALALIRSWPAHLCAHGLRFVHGFPPDSPTRYLFQVPAAEKRRILSEIPERICFVGHTHRLGLVAYTGDILEEIHFREGPNPLSPETKYLINVGSVGQPRDADQRAKYVIWDNQTQTLDIRCVPYDVRAAAAKILAAGLPEAHALRLIGDSRGR